MKKPELEVLVSAVNRELDELVASMKLASNAVIVNQSDSEDYQEKKYDFGSVKFYQYNERGVGLSRNRALESSTKDLLLFSDEDIIYDEGYADKVIAEFEKYPDADMLLFNFNVCEARATYNTTEFTKIRWYNSGRYPTYSIAIKREVLIKSGVKFSLLFGGGAKYGCGEDSIFIKNLVDKGLKIYAVPVCLGSERERESSWFKGYTEKFFFDKGVLFHYLYGSLAGIMAIRFVLLKKSFMCKDVPAKKAYKLIKDGIKQGIKEKKEENKRK